MSVRKRSWTTRKGEQKESWIVDYIDQGGDRHIRTFDRKKDADDYHVTVRVDVGKGIHTPHSKASRSPRPPRIGLITDVYGHLFPRREMAEAEKLLLA